MTLIIANVILDFAIIRWRRLSSFIMPLDLLFQLLISFVPSAHVLYSNLWVGLISILAHVFYYTMEPGQIVFSVCIYLAWSIVPAVLIYKAEFTFYAIFVKFCMAIGMFLIICLIAMSLVYIFQL